MSILLSCQKVFGADYRRPLSLIYYEACLDEDDAIKREKYFKSGFGRRFLRNRIGTYLRSICWRMLATRPPRVSKPACHSQAWAGRHCGQVAGRWKLRKKKNPRNLYPVKCLILFNWGCLTQTQWNPSIFHPRSFNILYGRWAGRTRYFPWAMCIQQAQTTQQIKSIERIEHFERTQW